MDGREAKRKGNRFSFDGETDGEAVIHVEQPSAEDVYRRHFLELNEDANTSRFNTKRLVDDALRRDDRNVPDGEDDTFKREDKYKLIKDDEDWLAKRRDNYDKNIRPKVRDQLPVATEDDELEMNRMAERLYGYKGD